MSLAWRARAGLDDDTLVHAVALSAFFGHLNRIADAVGVALDYAVKYPVEHAVPSTPRYELAPSADADADVTEGGLSLARRPATATALAAWRDYVMHRDAPLSRDERTAIAARVGGLLGASAPSTDGEHRELADIVTLAPWALGPKRSRPCARVARTMRASSTRS